MRPPRLVANHPREGWPKLATLNTGMNGDGGVGTPTPSLESVQELRLLVLLHDLVRREGQAGTAAVVGVHRKTVAAAVHTGRLSRRMRDALERHLLQGATAEAPTGKAEGQHQPWEQQLAAALRSEREALLATISAQGQHLRDAAAQRTQALEQRLAALEAHRGAGGGATPPGQQPQDGQQVAPQVVTAAPAPGEAAAFGVAAPLIVQWRQARAARAGAADRLTALRAEVRLRELEVALIETHGLTLPPAPAPWDALTRRNEVDWRRRTLARVRKERRWATWRRRLRRVLTLGLR